MEWISDYVIPYLPFFMFMIVISVVAQLLKTIVFTAQLAKRSKVIFWMRRMFPLILVAIGALVGMFWQGSPSDGVDTVGKKMLYFMGSSCVSITIWSSFRNWVKKKFDVELLKEETEEK